MDGQIVGRSSARALARRDGQGSRPQDSVGARLPACLLACSLGQTSNPRMAFRPVLQPFSSPVASIAVVPSPSRACVTLRAEQARAVGRSVGPSVRPSVGLAGWLVAEERRLRPPGAEFGHQESTRTPY